MKQIIRTTILHILHFLARRRIKKSGAKIIGITGSVGKSTCKDALVTLLSQKFTVVSSEGSYNTEFGLPLTILQEKSAYGSLLGWLLVVVRSAFKALLPGKIHFYILEMGIDSTGDMKTLLEIVSPDYAIVTRMGAVHLNNDQLPSVEAAFAEKSLLIKSVLRKKRGIALMNSDDPYQQDFIKKHHSDYLVTYSITKDCGGEKSIQPSTGGLTFTWKKMTYHAHFLGSWHIETILPAIQLAKHLGLHDAELQAGVEKIQLPKGRMSLIEGKNNTTIIDSSYNSNPLSVKKALTIFSSFPKQRKVFVFGNMNELGPSSEEHHREIGKIIPKYIDELITVGPGPLFAVEEATNLGFSQQHIHSFTTAEEAADFYLSSMETGDIVLVKGSQNNVRLERFIKKVMLHPEKAEDILVRQTSSWKKIS